MTYNVFGGTLNLAHFNSIQFLGFTTIDPNSRIYQRCNRSIGISAKLGLSRINRPIELFLYEKSIFP